MLQAVGSGGATVLRSGRLVRKQRVTELIVAYSKLSTVERKAVFIVVEGLKGLLFQWVLWAYR